MKHEYDQEFQKGGGWKRIKTIILVMLGFAGLFYLTKVYGLANFLVFGVLMILFFQFVLKRMIKTFQDKTWPYFMRLYERQLRTVLQGLSSNLRYLVELSAIEHFVKAHKYGHVLS